MNEERFAGRIRQALDQGANDLSPAVARRLEAARNMALSCQKQPAEEMAAAGHGSTFRLRLASRLPHFRQVTAIAALLLGMWLTLYWHSLRYHQNMEETDSALLADDLPPEVLLDDELLEWLKDDTPGQ